jgi:hypothetical protein
LPNIVAKPTQLITERLQVGVQYSVREREFQGTGLVWDRSSEMMGEEWAAHGPWREAGWTGRCVMHGHGECAVLRRADDLDDLRSTVTAGYISVCGVP